MVNPHQRKDGRWYVSIYIKKDTFGKKIYYTIYGKTKDECNSKALDFLYKKNHKLLEEKNDKTDTFEYYFDKWIEESSLIKAPATIEWQKSVKKNYLKPLLNVKLKDVNSKMIQELYNNILKENKGKTVLYKVDMCLRAFLKKTLKSKASFMQDVDAPIKHIKKHILITNSYLNKIIKLAEKEDNELFIIILIQSMLGLRIGEVFGLDKYKSFDWENNIVHVEQQQINIVGKGSTITDTLKTPHSHRDIPMKEPLISELKKYINKQETYFNINNIKPIDTALLLNKKGKKLILHTFRNHWLEFRKKYSIPDTLKPHDFRRYFATFLMKNKIPDKISKTLLGHTTVDMTQYYQNYDFETAKTLLSDLKTDIKI